MRAPATRLASSHEGARASSGTRDRSVGRRRCIGLATWSGLCSHGSRRKASGVPWRVLSSATARCAAGPEPYFIRTENGVSLGRLRKQSALCSSIPNARAVTFVSHSLSLHHCKLLASGCGTLARAPAPEGGGLDHLRASCSERRRATWLILPVVICLSQRLSHACLSISDLYCETANGSLNQLWFI